jgi:hypothetical protein
MGNILYEIAYTAAKVDEAATARTNNCKISFVIAGLRRRNVLPRSDLLSLEES